MAISLDLKSDGALEQIERNLAAAQQWLPKLTRKEIKRLGPIVRRKTMGMLGRNLYTGALMRSTTEEHEDEGLTVVVGPTLKAKQWDRGLILEYGTGPIARAPYAPITVWAGAKGAPRPGAWLKIRREGVSAHPWLDDAFDSIQSDLDKAQDNLLGSMIAAALHGATA